MSRKPPPKRRDPVTWAILALGAVAGAAIWVGITDARTHPAPSAPLAVTSTPAVSTAATASQAREAAACEDRHPQAGDFYLRMLSPGAGWYAQELGDEWKWDYTTGKCLTGVQFMLATAPETSGSCTQAGYVASNPGYDVNGTPAPPLKSITDETGPAC